MVQHKVRCLVGGLFAIGVAGCDLIHVRSSGSFSTSQPHRAAAASSPQAASVPVAAPPPQRAPAPAPPPAAPPAGAPAKAPYGTASLAPAQPARAASPAASDVSWADELRTTEQLDATLTGDERTDAGRLAAREMTVQFIEVMSGADRLDQAGMPLEARRHLMDYLSPSPLARDKATVDQARKHLDDASFRRKLYAKLFSRRWQAAYWSSAQGRKLIEAEDNAAQARAVTPDPRKTVFGIALDVPLEQLPACQMVHSVSTPVTCVQGIMTGSLHTMELVTGPHTPPGMQRFALKLATDRCPNYVDRCSVVVTTKDGIALSVELASASISEEDLIVSKLVERFGPAQADGSTRCAVSSVTTSAKVRRWSKGGLRIAYMPHAPRNCLYGYISVQTEGYIRLLEQLEKSAPAI